MKTAITFLFLLAAVGGCKSPSAQATDFPCNCGTPEAALEPCLHPRCAEGMSNPANPDCACGTMKIGEKK